MAFSLNVQASVEQVLLEKDGELRQLEARLSAQLAEQAQQAEQAQRDLEVNPTPTPAARCRGAHAAGSVLRRAVRPPVPTKHVLHSGCSCAGLPDSLYGPFLIQLAMTSCKRPTLRPSLRARTPKSSG